MKKRTLALATMGTAQVLLMTSAYGYNTSEDWRWKASSLGTAPVRGTAIQVGWSIPVDGTAIAGTTATNNLNSTLSTNLGIDPMTMFRYMFNRVGAVSGLQFVETPDDGSIATQFQPGIAGVRGDVRIVGRNLGGGVSGWSNMPSPNETCVIQMNTNPAVSGGWVYNDWVNVTMHEIGHASGLAHQQVFVDSVTMTPDLNASIVGLCNKNGPQFDDVYALNYLYGDTRERNGGNDTRQTASDLGTIRAGAVKALGTSAVSTTVRLNSTAKDFLSIDGTSDTDFFKFHLGAQRTMTMSVTPKGPTYDFTPEGGVRQSINASEQSDLWFDLLNASGQSLSHVDLTGLGGTESLTTILAIGDYYIKVAGTQDSNQMYRLDLADTTGLGLSMSNTPMLVSGDIDVGMIAVPEPTSLGLIGIGAIGLLARRRRKVEIVV